MTPRMPRWMAKHPCIACGSGYGQCAQYLRFSLKCCVDCEHPGRWEPNPYTDEDRAEMAQQSEPS